jgi:RNA recognition motif-containing protein
MTPSSILFAQNLPVDCTDVALSMLFKVHNGFKEVRMVNGKPGIAFVEFEDEFKASTALQSLNGFKLTPTDSMALSYAKK